MSFFKKDSLSQTNCIAREFTRQQTIVMDWSHMISKWIETNMNIKNVHTHVQNNDESTDKRGIKACTYHHIVI